MKVCPPQEKILLETSGYSSKFLHTKYYRFLVNLQFWDYVYNLTATAGLPWSVSSYTENIFVSAQKNSFFTIILNLI